MRSTGREPQTVCDADLEYAVEFRGEHDVALSLQTKTSITAAQWGLNGLALSLAVMKAFWASSYHEMVRSLENVYNGKHVLPCPSQFEQRRHLEDHINRVRSSLHNSSTPTVKN